MTIRAWLTTSETDPDAGGIRLGIRDDGVREATIPVTQMGLGGRVSTYPGIFHDPRVRPYSDKLATPTGPDDPRPVTFSVRLEGPNFDVVRANWSVIETLLSQAEEAASAWSRGTGVYYIEQWEDASQLAIWDVISGVPTDQDLNEPGNIWLGMVLQIVVRPYARGPIAALGSFSGNLSNPATPFVTNVQGDADALTEIQCKDVSSGGEIIRRLRIGCRGYANGMTSTDCTLFYNPSGSVALSSSWQTAVTQNIAAGNHQTGYFAVSAVVNDGSPVIATPVIDTATTAANAGLLSTGTWQYLFFGKDASGRWGPPSPMQTLQTDNLQQSGGLQVPMTVLDYDGAESQQWIGWNAPPSVGSVAGSLAQIDNSSPLDGYYSFHLKAVGQTSGADCISSASRTLPVLPASKIKSTRFLFNAASWSPDTGAGTVSAPTAVDSSGGGSFPAGTFAYVMTLVTQTSTGFYGYSYESSPSTATDVTVSASDQVKWTAPSTPADIPPAFVPPGPGYSFTTYSWNLYQYYAGDPSNNILPGYYYVASAKQSVVTFLSNPLSDPASKNPPAGGLAGSFRFRWGNIVTLTQAFNGIQMVGTETPGEFNMVASYQGSGTASVPQFPNAILSTVTLATDTTYLIEFNYDNSGAVPRWRVYISEPGGSPANTVLDAGVADASLIEPTTLIIQAVALTQDPAYTEEFRFDDVTTADQFLGAVAGIGGGSANTFDLEAIDNAAETWAFWQSTSADGTTVNPWMAQKIGTGGALTWTHNNQFPDNSFFANPPLGALAVNNAEVRALVGGSSSMLRAQRAYSTIYGDGVDHLVGIGTMSIPGSVPNDYSGFPSNGCIAVQARSGGTNTDTLTVKGLVLFPMDAGAERWAGVTATAPTTLAAQALWKIGVTRFGFCYVELWDAATGTTFYGYADVTGRLGLHEGSDQLVIFMERQDSSGRWVADLSTLAIEYALRTTPRYHLGPMPAIQAA